jgi:dolichol-phosphate hexosyltransferase
MQLQAHGRPVGKQKGWGSCPLSNPGAWAPSGQTEGWGKLSAVQPLSEPDSFAPESVPGRAGLSDGPHRREVSAQLNPQQTIALTRGALKLSILMAAYNEESTVTHAIAEVLRASYPIDIELIVVDDGSTDSTQMLLAELEDDRLIVHRHPVNQGKGAALRTAASLATGTHMLPFDADLEYISEDIPKVLEPVLKGRSSVVYGVRLSGCNTVYRSYWYATGNRLLTGLANILFNANLSDLHTCLKLIPTPMLRDLKLNESGFGLDTEVTALLLRRGVRPFEVPISYYGRSHAQGKKITWRDAFACAWILFRVRIRIGSRGLPRHADEALERESRDGPHSELDNIGLVPLSASWTATADSSVERSASRSVVGSTWSLADPGQGDEA